MLLFEAWCNGRTGLQRMNLTPASAIHPLREIVQIVNFSDHTALVCQVGRNKPYKGMSAKAARTKRHTHKEQKVCYG